MFEQFKQLEICVLAGTYVYIYMTVNLYVYRNISDTRTGLTVKNIYINV